MGGLFCCYIWGGFFEYKSQLNNIFSTRVVEKIASSLPDECPMKGHLIRNYVHWPKGDAFVDFNAYAVFLSELTTFKESIGFNKDNSFDVFFYYYYYFILTFFSNYLW